MSGQATLLNTMTTRIWQIRVARDPLDRPPNRPSRPCSCASKPYRPGDLTFLQLRSPRPHTSFPIDRPGDPSSTIPTTVKPLARRQAFSRAIECLYTRPQSTLTTTESYRLGLRG